MLAWFEKTIKKFFSDFPTASGLLMVSFLAIAVFFSAVTVSGVILKSQRERHYRLEEQGITEADFRKIESQKIGEKINDLKAAASRALVPIAALLAFLLLLKVVWRQIKEFMGQSAQKTGFKKFLFILAFIVMIFVVLLQVAAALFAYWMSTGPSSGGSVMGGMGAAVIGVLVEEAYWIGTLGGLFLILASGHWRYFFRTFCICSLAFLLFLLFAPDFATLLVMGLSYDIFQITWALQHLE